MIKEEIPLFSHFSSSFSSFLSLKLFPVQRPVSLFHRLPFRTEMKQLIKMKMETKCTLGTGHCYYSGAIMLLTTIGSTEAPPENKLLYSIS